MISSTFWAYFFLCFILVLPGNILYTYFINLNNLEVVYYA
nr:MAG TPA: hypothetical protein [Caudoviricetes sp.]